MNADPFGFDASGKAREQERAAVEALSIWGMYLRTGNGAFVWRALKLYRDAGLAVPDALMSKLAEFAARLADASGPAEVAEAVEMTGARGGVQGSTRARLMLESREIVAVVHDLMSTGRITQPVACARVAARYRKTPRQVSDMHRRWMQQRTD